MAHDPMFWVIVVGLVLAVALVGGGWARMREQRRHVRAMLRDTFQTAPRRHARSRGCPSGLYSRAKQLGATPTGVARPASDE